jgi:hypothetical protein
MESLRPVHVAPTTDRKAERGKFENALRGAAAGAAGGLATTLTLAAPFVPGGPILAGAVRGATSPPPSALGPTTGSGATGTALVAGSDVDLLAETRKLQVESQLFNVEYLRLQEELQRESREFNAVSNVMKVRHDTAKAAIHNIH